MRAGVIISAVSHLVLVFLVLLGTPKLFEVTVQSIEVDLVRPEEVEQPKEKAPEPEKDKWGLVPDRSSEQAATAPSEAMPPAQTQPAPARNQQAAVAPDLKPAMDPPGRPTRAPSIFDPAAIPMLLDLPNAPERGFDAESTTTANLSDDERAAFKTHLRKCWKLPGGLSSTQTTRVVLRIYLRRDARLAGEPVLIEASASRDGPVVMQTALRALKECQPYGFLPAAKYNEWKILDLSFTPRDMAGG